MSNHYHLLVETLEANLSRGMRQLNGLYSQHFNGRNELVGHVFQGRYKAILVQKERYLLELARYIVLNPVRAHIVMSPDNWYWSSHHYFLDDAAAPCRLARDWLLSQFGDTRDGAGVRSAIRTRPQPASTRHGFRSATTTQPQPYQCPA